MIFRAAIVAAIGSAIVEHLQFDRLAAPYRKKIDDAAARHNINKNVLASILYKESRFNPAAVGSSGEIGLGQFKEIAAQDVGLSIADIKNDPALQIEAAARLLALNTGRLKGNFFDAIRAYNVGIGTARQDAAAGLDYALDVMRHAFIDNAYLFFSGYRT